MKLITSIAAASAAVIAGAGAFTVPAIASTPAAATHTLEFISVSKDMVVFAKTSAGFQDTDVNQAGKTIGFDETILTDTSATSSAGNVTVDIKGGMLYGTFTISPVTGKITDGKVAGGTGAYTKAAGTFSAKAISQTRLAVTVTYRT
jgi:hypothetical protein